MKASRAEVQRFCTKLINLPAYRAQLEIRLCEGTLPPQMEQMIWAYAAGKPTETLDLNLGDGTNLDTLTTGQLLERLEKLRVKLAAKMQAGVAES